MPTSNDATPTELDVRIWRGGEDGAYAHYRVPFRESQTVLDVVTFVQRHLDSTLSYRFACRVGMCGSCAMTVNGAPRWTCRTHVSKVAEDGVITIGPLRNLPVIKDLACDMTEFFEKWQRAKGRFSPTRSRREPFERISPETPKRKAVDAGIECINCGVCYSACEVVSLRRDYLGPAALNRAWTLVNDTRDAEHDARIAAVSGDAGCHNCHSHQSCVDHCPKQLSPTASIAGLKRASVGAAWRRLTGR
ncbi:MAG: succinate dehydrogenase/fumarate reductase iron-sulfur subunit [Ectothiorhodospiraceae bacterium]|nr:succinate dehydrogenase/fumarate reductase iron-sulfur subunit [Ectothiorhodospiraceae bacterium]